MRVTFFLLSLLFCCISCNDNSNGSVKKQATLPLLDSITNFRDTVEKPIAPIIIEESKINEKYKAFNDIYFTTKKPDNFVKKFNSYQELAELDFKVGDEKYDDDYGLYEFSLNCRNFKDINEVQKNLERIYLIINKISKQNRDLNDTEKLSAGGLAWDNTLMLASGKEPNKPPNDDGMYYFKKEFFQNIKSIRIGYSTYYSYEKKIEMKTYIGQNGSYQAPEQVGVNPDKFNKQYSIFLIFTCTEITSKISIKKNNNETLKNVDDANKF